MLQFDRSSWHILGRSNEVGLFACKVILHNANGSAYVSTFFNAKVRQSAAAVAQHNLKSWRHVSVVHINLYAYRYHCAISLMALCCPFSSTECL